ncbi:MAG: hypothetical protein AAFQ09_09505, partial [Pseudomonadota bacterium]
MKLALPKTFGMMKLLNRDYGGFGRGVAAAGGAILVWMITLDGTLTREMARRFWTHQDFKLAVRRGAWYCRRGWPNLDVSTDDFFDPTEGMTDRELAALTRFVQARRLKHAPVIHASDLAIIAARQLNNNTDTSQRAANTADFVTTANAMLALPVDPDLALSTPDTPRTGDFPIENAKTTLKDFAALFPTD